MADSASFVLPWMLVSVLLLPQAVACFALSDGYRNRLDDSRYESGDAENEDEVACAGGDDGALEKDGRSGVFVQLRRAGLLDASTPPVGTPGSALNSPITPVNVPQVDSLGLPPASDDLIVEIVNSSDITATNELEAAITNTDVRKISVQMSHISVQYELSPIKGDITIAGEDCRLEGARCTLEAAGRFRLLNLQARVTLRALRLVNGTAAYFGGGGILVQGPSGHLQMHNCEVSYNTDEFLFGGGILALFAAMEITDSAFTGNIGSLHGGGGGGVAVVRGELYAVNCTFHENAGYWGGAAGILDFPSELSEELPPELQDDPNSLFEISTMTFVSCLFTNNIGFSDGGALVGYFCAGNMQANQHIVAIDSHFYNNSAVTYGGAIVLFYYCHLSLTNSTFEGNYCSGDGGAAHVFKAGITADRVSMRANEAVQGGALSLSTSSFLIMTNRSDLSDNVAYNFGGGVLCQKSTTCEIRHTHMRNNSATAGGGIYIAIQAVLTLEQAAMHLNMAKTFGAGLYVKDSTADMADSLMVGNNCLQSGGAMWLENAEVQMAYLVLKNNSAMGCLVEGNMAWLSSGGGLEMVNSALDLTDSVVRGNKGSKGGCLSVLDWSTLELVNVTMEQCEAEQSGGALRLGLQCLGNISQSMLRNNRATLEGGAVHLEPGGRLEMRRTSVTDNVATDGDGGGILMEMQSDQLLQSDLVLRESVVLASNQAPRGYGGALFISPPLRSTPHVIEMSNLTMEDNLAMHGHCILWEHPEGVEDRNLTVPSCAGCQCTVDGSPHPTLATTAVDFHMNQPLGTVVTRVNVSSGTVVFPELIYVARDYYENILPSTRQATQTFVSSYITSNQSDSEDKQLLSGSLAEYFTSGAVFSSLEPVAPPGKLLVLEFQPSDADPWRPVRFEVQLLACVNGEVYDTITQSCIPCEPGSIKFGNESESCLQCPEGMTCHGGSSYTLEAGYWIAPGATDCSTDACVLAMAGVSVRVARGVLILCWQSEQYRRRQGSGKPRPVRGWL
ncbi:hypothetical protein CYMTET_14543 [Cymbomonas tetramitiformis]|uniref:Right handed beta helix domain-containing protein n=1 Tax=Cymbomonas tetramitiformis TaxID=36881 RepID=A0AAE0GG65_9CHLO|nr:hypothetical protein CYMTET_14543 [Cymbomonas tetramitiformis]